MMRARFPLILTLFTLSLTASTGCARYQFGSRTLYRPDVRTVHVPVFKSDSFRRGLGERITEAVVKEIESNTPYKVVSREMADSVIEGSLVRDRKLVRARTRTDEPRFLRNQFVIRYSWQDKRGDMLQQPVYMSLSPQLLNGSEVVSADFFPEVGQSITTAQEESIRQFAKQLVIKMQAPW